MNSEYKLIYHRDAVKFLAKQTSTVQDRIAKGLAGLLELPPKGDIQLMKGRQNLYRLRIGVFRVLFRINHVEKTIAVEAINYRGDIYK